MENDEKKETVATCAHKEDNKGGGRKTRRGKLSMARTTSPNSRGHRPKKWAEKSKIKERRKYETLTTPRWGKAKKRRKKQLESLKSIGKPGKQW